MTSIRLEEFSLHEPAGASAEIGAVDLHCCFRSAESQRRSPLLVPAPATKEQ